MRCKRKKKTFVYKLSNGQILKMRLLPWMKSRDSCIWLISLAVAKSKRQINDWLNERKNKPTKNLKSRLTGKHGPLIQAIAVRKMREWLQLVPEGDSVCFRCESSIPDKQFAVWKRWFERHEDPGWIVNEQFKYFLYYK